jgi:hypothetical protein
MHRFTTLLLSALALLGLSAATASATLNEYSFTSGSGSAYSISSGTTLWSGSPGSITYSASASFDIGFNFIFDGTTYTRMSANVVGAAALGTTNVTTTYVNSLNGYGSSTNPYFAVFWDQSRVDGAGGELSNKVQYQVFGSAPNRVMVVEWLNLNFRGSTYGYYCQRNAGTFQLRLFEGSNRIEYYYGVMNPCSAINNDCYGTTTCWATSASIGISKGASEYMSVTPTGSLAATMSRSVVNNNVDMNAVRFTEGTLYTFAPCNISIAGNVAQGGTALMAPGDTLFRTTSVQRGNTQGFQPLTINNTTGGCSSRNWTAAISGTNASDYVLSATSGTLSNPASFMPTITFTPSGTGVRTATLTVTDNNNYLRTFVLRATGSSRITWNPTIAEGGTAGLANNDTLLRNIMVVRRSSRDLTPITLTNVNGNPIAPPAIITATIDSAGTASTQYSIVGPSSAALIAGQSYSPVIRFSPSGVGPQSARLTINAEGEIRTYTLFAVSGAPIITVMAAGVAVDAGNPLLSQTNSCVGDFATIVPVTISNTGTLPLSINDIKYYGTDTTYQQGTPQLPLLRTPTGALVPLSDYVLSDVPGGIPLSATPQATTPFTLAPGATRTLYLTFVGQTPGKRFGRIYVRTNAENVDGIDTNAYNGTTTFPTRTLGLYTADVVGRAIGSALAATANGGKLSSVIMPNTRIGDTSEATFTIANTGACVLRISSSKFRISSGDVTDIKLVHGLRNSQLDAVTGDYLVAPGAVDTVRVRFIPSRSGTRLARLWIQTNDSTIFSPGISERGAYYLDIYGRGLAGLDAHPLVLDPVTIGNSVSGIAVLENSLNVAVAIGSISFMGDDAAEFAEDNGSWPDLPHTVLPGAKLSLGVRMTPTGNAGQRRTMLVLVTTTGDTIRVPIKGEAGTQMLVVSPNSLFMNVTISAGQVARQTVSISNNGTLPLRITSIRIVGPDSLAYRLGVLPRFGLDPGQSEYLEVTFVPTTLGQMSAQLEVTDANGQVYRVELGGTATRVRREPVDPTQTKAPFRDDDPARRNDDGSATKGRPTLR